MVSGKFLTPLYVWDWHQRHCEASELHARPNKQLHVPLCCGRQWTWTSHAILVVRLFEICDAHTDRTCSLLLFKYTKSVLTNVIKDLCKEYNYLHYSAWHQLPRWRLLWARGGKQYKNLKPLHYMDSFVMYLIIIFLYDYFLLKWIAISTRLLHFFQTDAHWYILCVCVCVCLLVVCMLNACAYLCVCLCVRACLQPQQSLQQCLLPATNRSSPTCSTRVCFRLEWLTSSSSPLCVHHRPACGKTSSASMSPVTHLVPALQPYPSIPISSSIID